MRDKRIMTLTAATAIGNRDFAEIQINAALLNEEMNETELKENRDAARPFGHFGGHRRAHVAQADVAERQVLSHDRITCPPSTLKI